LKILWKKVTTMVVTDHWYNYLIDRWESSGTGGHCRVTPMILDHKWFLFPPFVNIIKTINTICAGVKEQFFIWPGMGKRHCEQLLPWACNLGTIDSYIQHALIPT
jgi:hypothetical protein